MAYFDIGAKDVKEYNSLKLKVMGLTVKKWDLEFCCNILKKNNILTSDQSEKIKSQLCLLNTEISKVKDSIVKIEKKYSSKLRK